MARETYIPAENSFSFKGVPITGFMDGSYIVAERDEDSFSKHTGGDGNTARVRNPNRAGAITIRLQQTSPSNDVLAAFASLDELTGAGQGPAMVKDNSGTSKAGGDSWIRKPAAMSQGVELEGREWIFDVASPMMLLPGGNVAAT